MTGDFRPCSLCGGRPEDVAPITDLMHESADRNRYPYIGKICKGCALARKVGEERHGVYHNGEYTTVGASGPRARAILELSEEDKTVLALSTKGAPGRG